MAGLPVGSDWSLDKVFAKKTQAGTRLKLHLRDPDQPDRTWCGRARDCLQEELPNGDEVWSNGSHLIAVTDRLEAVECQKCK